MFKGQTGMAVGFQIEGRYKASQESQFIQEVKGELGYGGGSSTVHLADIRSDNQIAFDDCAQTSEDVEIV
jgi:hypothetical protein